MKISQFYADLINKQIPIFTDNNEIVSFLKNRGYPVSLSFNLESIKHLPQSLVIPTNYALQNQSNQLWQESFNSTIMLFSAVKFGQQIPTIQYTLEQFFNLNLDELLALRAGFYQILAATNQLTLLNQNESKLEVVLYDKLETANRDEVLKTNWQYSITEICEASLVNLKHDKSSFSCEGLFYFDGIISTISNQENRNQNRAQIESLTEAVNQACDKYIVIKENAITRLMLDGEDCISLLEAMNYTELERGLSITEIAFGCNKNILKNINWQYNSVANEDHVKIIV